MAFERDYGRYIVFKRADIKRYLSDQEEEQLSQLLGRMQQGRITDGKRPYHDYICVRQDAKYAGAVWALIEAESVEKVK